MGITAAALASLLLLTTATPEEEARTYAEQGNVSYKLGRFEEAIAAYQQAYDRKPVAGLLFNIAQCYFALEQYDKATFTYRRFLSDAPDAPNRALVEQRLKEAHAKKAEQERSAKERAEQERVAKERAEQQRLQSERERLEADIRLAEKERARLSAQKELTAEERATLEAAERLVNQNRALLAAERQRAPGREPVGAPTPMYEEVWFWPTVGGAALASVAIAGTAATLLFVPWSPAASLGTADWRGER